MSVIFESKFVHSFSRKSIWKCPLRNQGFLFWCRKVNMKKRQYFMQSCRILSMTYSRWFGHNWQPEKFWRKLYSVEFCRYWWLRICVNMCTHVCTFMLSHLHIYIDIYETDPWRVQRNLVSNGDNPTSVCENQWIWVVVSKAVDITGPHLLIG